MTAAADQPGAPLLEFAEVMRRLRAECPWKAGQTHRSLARYLLEETYETLEALDTGDAAHLREELGDLLLQVYFHGVIAEQEGEFTLDDVARDITAKMIRRNPHVFGDAGAELPVPADAAAVNELWEQRKAAEKARSEVTEGLPAALPALLYADKLLDRLARAGRPVRPGLVGEVVEEVVEEASGDPGNDPAHDPEHDPAVDLGDRLLALVAEGRMSGTDPEQALRDACRRLLDSGPPSGRR